jgi:hypothetical protein
MKNNLLIKALDDYPAVRKHRDQLLIRIAQLDMKFGDKILNLLNIDEAVSIGASQLGPLISPNIITRKLDIKYKPLHDSFFKFSNIDNIYIIDSIPYLASAYKHKL